jgi:hypothetical protein
MWTEEPIAKGCQRRVVHPAAIQDRDGAGLVLDKIRRRFPRPELMLADGDYNAWQADAAVAKVPLLRMELVKRSCDMERSGALPRRLVVERTFSWFRRKGRLEGFREPRRNLATPSPPFSLLVADLPGFDLKLAVGNAR